MNLLQLSWKNISSKPLNTGLSLLLFALGTGLISLLLNLNHQIEENFNKNLAGIDLVIGAKGSPLQLILCSMYHVDNPTGNVSLEKSRAFLNPKHPLIRLAVPLSLGDSYRGYRIAGTTWDILRLYDARLAEGKLWEKPMEVTIGAAVAKKLHLHIGDTFKSSHGLVEGLEEHEHDFRVVGILQPTSSVIDQLIMTPTESIWESHQHQESAAADVQADRSAAAHQDHSHDGHAHEEVSHEHVSVAPVSYDSLQLQQRAEADMLRLMEATDKEITAILVRFRSRTNIQALNLGRNINQNTELMAASPPNEIARLQTNVGVGTEALKAMAWVIILVSGLSIFISLFSSLKERKYELALLRVMGGSPGTLFRLILLEGLLLSALGYVAGMLMSHLSLSFLAGMLQESYRYSFSGWRLLPAEAGLLLGALVTGIAAALIPAWQARRTDISETLSKG